MTSGPVPVDLEVTLRGVPVDEALVHYVRQCAVSLSPLAGRSARWEVRVQGSTASRRPTYEVAIDVSSPAARISLHHADPDEFLAVRDAFQLVGQQLGTPPKSVASA